MTPEQDIKQLFKEEWSFFRAAMVVCLVIAGVHFWLGMGDSGTILLLAALICDTKHDIEKLKRSQS